MEHSKQLFVLSHILRHRSTFPTSMCKCCTAELPCNALELWLQALEAEVAIAFSLRPKKCLLVGDPMQLPATLLSVESQRNGSGRSLMQRLMQVRILASQNMEQTALVSDKAPWTSAEANRSSPIDCRDGS